MPLTQNKPTLLPPWLEENANANAMQLLRSYQRAIDFNVICSITDVYGTIIYVNDRFCEVSQYTKQELLGQNHRIINSGHHSKEFFEQMWKTITKGAEWVGEVKNKAKNGTFYWVDTIVLPIYDNQHKIIQFLSLRHLITEKKLAEEELEREKMELENLLALTSHKIRGPISTCLGLVNLLNLDKEKPLSIDEIKAIITHLKSSATELELFTHRLTQSLHDLKEKKQTME